MLPQLPPMGRGALRALIWANGQNGTWKPNCHNDYVPITVLTEFPKKSPRKVPLSQNNWKDIIYVNIKPNETYSIKILKVH